MRQRRSNGWSGGGRGRFALWHAHAQHGIRNFHYAFAAGVWGLNGWPILGGVALAFYTAGLGEIGRRKNNLKPISLWPLALLAAPIALAFAMNAGSFRTRAIGIAIIFAAWTIWSVRKIFTGNVAIIASNLFAGIVFVDWLAVAPQMAFWPGAVIFLALFGLTKWLQKFAPAA